MRGGLLLATPWVVLCPKKEDFGSWAPKFSASEGKGPCYATFSLGACPKPDLEVIFKGQPFPTNFALVTYSGREPRLAFCFGTSLLREDDLAPTGSLYLSALPIADRLISWVGPVASLPWLLLPLTREALPGLTVEPASPPDECCLLYRLFNRSKLTY